MLKYSDAIPLIESLKFDRLLRLLGLLPVDDEVSLIALMPEKLRESVLGALKGDEKAQLEDLLSWPEESAGVLMHPAAFRLRENQTC